MALDLSYPKILEYIVPFKGTQRSESAAFLIWYLVNFYRLDELEATDCVCDQSGDKGVDGIYVNEGAGTIDVFQSKISQKAGSSVGDKQLREFKGTLAQFESVAALQNLLDTAGDVQVAALIRRLDLKKKIQDYEVRGVFVVNLEIDPNGSAFLNTAPMKFVGRSYMESSYISDKKDPLQTGIAAFDIFGLSITDYSVDANTKATIAPVLASDLIKLSGIADQSLFSSNVRASLGNTAVNRDIVSSIKNAGLHKAFPLFHNGITVLAKSVQHDERNISVEDYYVVNGCQSLNALYSNRADISDDLRILTKFIQVQVGSDLAELITTNSNNQNGVKARDFKSNHPIQSRLQNEFQRLYAGQYAFEVKRGEPSKDGVLISNEDAGLFIVAFDLMEPWTTHRKYQVFDERYTQIFGRPDVTADKIVFLYEISEALKRSLPALKNDLVGKYVLTKFIMLLTVRRILELDGIGGDMIAAPEKYIRDAKNRARFQKTMDALISALIIDLDVETQDLGTDFDYRGKLRDKEYVVSLVNTLVATYRKDLLRNKAQSIGDVWASIAI
jgi:hypothetical protein